MPATDLAHPVDNRPLSIQEYKRIQQFPDDWIICGSLVDQYRQVGNAVPVGLGEAIGKLILNHMNGSPVKVYEGFPYSRYKDTDHKSWLAKHSNVGFKRNVVNQRGVVQRIWICSIWFELLYEMAPFRGHFLTVSFI